MVGINIIISLLLGEALNVNSFYLSFGCRNTPKVFVGEFHVDYEGIKASRQCSSQEFSGMPRTQMQLNAERRKKRNKYEKFSKVEETELDPWEKLLLDSKTKQEEIQNEIASKDRRKATPKQRDSTEIRERNKFEWPDVKEIDPYDPTTYGYVELGTIIGAHGVKGELKLVAITDFSEMRLCSAGKRHLKLPNRRSPREIQLISGRRQSADNYLVSLINRQFFLECNQIHII